MQFSSVALAITAILGSVSATPASPPGLWKPIDISGEYVCTKYGASHNDWHFVTVTATDGRAAYEWKNKAGVSWSIKHQPQDPKDVFKVGEECPYYKFGYTTAVVDTKREGKGKKPTAIHGPGDEIYTLKSLIDPWNAVFCPYGTVDNTCWAGSASQKCPNKSQWAYDRVMSKYDRGQKGMYKEYLWVISTC